MVSIHGNSIDEKIVALRLVKKFICSEGGFSTIIITTELLQSPICEIITFKVSNVFGSPTKDKWKWRKDAFGEGEGSCWGGKFWK